MKEVYVIHYKLTLHNDKQKKNLIPIHKIAHSFFGYLVWYEAA